MKALEGIKVADFTWYAAGPYVTRYLALQGAIVIRIESSTRIDRTRLNAPFKDDKVGVNRSGQFALFNPNKYSITLNLKDPRGLEIAKRLVVWSDVVAENFTAGTMEGFGLGYQELKKLKPEIIMLSSTNQGQTGPNAKQAGFGLQLEALSGFVHISGWPDRAPVIHGGINTDTVAARFGVVALLAALDYRRRTGKGQYIDLAQYEAGLYFLAPLLLDFDVNGRVASKTGNRCSFAAPHGVYPCKGDDRWCAITVFNDEEWQAICECMGHLEWVKEGKFTTLLGRKEKEDELDKLIAEWTSQFEAEKLAAMLQAKGVSAGVVKNAGDIYQDPQLAHRGQWKEIEHREIGNLKYDMPGYLLPKAPPQLDRPAPCLGEHNEYVCTQILGMEKKLVEQLAADGVLK